MTSLVLAAAFFFGIHVLISGTRLRDAIVASTSERAFLGLFSVLSIFGMVWLVRAYGGAPLIPVWAPLIWFRPIALVLMLLAFLLVVIGLTTPTPTAVTIGESSLERGEPARGILRITRHPFLMGVALWGITHFIASGDAASLVLFGSLFAVAAVGPSLIDGKRARRFGPSWERFAGTTSVVPFAAIAQGRNSFVLGEIGIWRIVLAVALYVVFLWTHPSLFGVSPLAF